jgi:hypothetical protein
MHASRVRASFTRSYAGQELLEQQKWSRSAKILDTIRDGEATEDSILP